MNNQLTETFGSIAVTRVVTLALPCPIYIKMIYMKYLTTTVGLSL